MTTDLNKIKARILALSAKTVSNGCSEEEAMAAIQMVGKLLTQYNLSMDEVELRTEECNTLKIDSGSKQRGGVYFTVMAIGAFTNCKVWINRGNTLVYCFFGQESDLLMAKYLYDVITSAIEHETEMFKKTPVYAAAISKKGASSSFAIGMGTRIAERIMEMKYANEEEIVAARGGSNALIILKNQVVEDAFRNLSLRMKKNYGRTAVVNALAYHNGQTAGNCVNLSRPVNGNREKVFQIAG